MPELDRPDGARIHYEVAGDGSPVLLLPRDVDSASGGAAWRQSVLDPVIRLGEFALISVDNRNAGQSTGPATAFSYAQAADDQLAVLDELGVGRVGVLGESVGASMAWALARRAGERVTAVVCVRPPGVHASVNKHAAFLGLFSETMRTARAAGLAGVVDAALEGASFSRNPAAGPLGQRIRADGEFRERLLGIPVEVYNALMVRYRDGLYPAQTPLFSVPTQWLASCDTPQLIVAGNDRYHPDVLADFVLDYSPCAARLPAGSLDGDLGATTESIRQFLSRPRLRVAV